MASIIGALVILCAINSCLQVHGGLLHLPFGAFVLKFKQLYVCPDQGTGQIQIGTKISSAGKGRYIFNSTISMGVPLDDNFQVHLETFLCGNGGYKRVFDFFVKDCQQLWTFVGDAIESYLKSSGVAIKKCQIPKGNYTTYNWESKFQLNRFAIMYYSEYKSIFNYFYKGVKVGCIIALVEFVPKTTA